MKFRSRQRQESSFQVAPMLDIFMILLCFFAVTQFFAKWETEIDLKIPTSDTGSLAPRTPGEIILNLHPLNWPRHMFFCCDPDDVDWYPGSDRLAMKLGSSGIMYECDLETRNGGHSWEYFDHMAPKVVGFVAERLDQVRRQAV